MTKYTSKLQAEECGCEVKGCECGNKPGVPLELVYKKTWKQRKKTGPLCECFGNRTGCAFSLVIFPDSEKSWTRNKGNLHDRDGDYAGPRCRGCNTTYGKIHHVNCDDEKCPRCDGQILTCNCNGKYGHVFLDDKGSKNYEHLNFYGWLVLPKEASRVKKNGSNQNTDYTFFPPQ
jgi:hypothetical protein